MVGPHHHHRVVVATIIGWWRLPPGACRMVGATTLRGDERAATTR